MSASQKPSVLLLVDSDEDAAIYRAALESSFEVSRIAIDAAAPVMIQRTHPSVVLMDFAATDAEGRESPSELAYQLRVHPNPKTYTAIVCVVESSILSLPTSEDASDRGVEVYCTRQQARAQPRALIKRALRVRATMQELTLLNRQHADVSERLKKLSLTDDLTGLYNMRFMTRQMQSEFQRAERYSKNLSLLVVNIDHFRQFQAATVPLDRSPLITQIGQDIGDAVRFEVDYAARSGTDEFVILLPETPLAGAIVVAERLRCKVAQTAASLADSAAPLTASVGIAHYCGPDPAVRSIAELFRLAEENVRKAKAAGCDQIFSAPRLLSPASF